MKPFNDTKILDNLKPEKFFLVIAFILGLLYLLITPPFEVPDEINHFYRAYQVSEGHLSPVKLDNRLGGYIPKNIVKFTIPYLKIRFKSHYRITFDTIVNSSKIKLNKNDKIFVDFPNTAMYSFVSYLPQSIAIYFCRQLNCRPFYMLYIARFVTFIFWLTIIFFSIKMMPIYKWLFALLALTPTSLFINSSVSADIINNFLSWFLIAYIFSIAFGERKYTNKSTLIITVFSVLLAISKILYATLFLLFFIIPLKKKFKSTKHYIISISIIGIITMMSAFSFQKSVKSFYTPYSQYNASYRDYITLSAGGDMEKQIDFIKNNKVKTVYIFIKSFFYDELNLMTKSYIGRLGWLDCKLPFALILSYLFVIFLISRAEYDRKIYMNLWQKIVLFLVASAMILLIMLSQYLTWDPVGNDVVYPMQGRYFIPVFPLLFVLFYNHKSKIDAKIIQKIIVILVVFVGIFTFFAIKWRYYHKISQKTYLEYNISAENISNDNDYILSSVDSIKFRNNNILSTEVVFRGNYVMKLTNKNQFACTYTVDLKKGDILIASVWKTTPQSLIVFQEYEGTCYDKFSMLVDDKGMWKKIENRYYANRDIDNVRIYLWYPGNDIAYFDDFNVKIIREIKK